MGDVVWIAIISAASAVLGGAVTSLGAVLGPRWMAAGERKALQERERYAARRDAVDGFLAALVEASVEANGRSAKLRAAAKARFKVLSVLEPGEAGVQECTAWLLSSAEYLDAQPLADLVTRGGDALYSWLRNEVKAEDLPTWNS